MKGSDSVRVEVTYRVNRLLVDLKHQTTNRKSNEATEDGSPNTLGHNVPTYFGSMKQSKRVSRYQCTVRFIRTRINIFTKKKIKK